MEHIWPARYGRDGITAVSGEATLHKQGGRLRQLTPGTQAHRYRCSLPGLAGFTATRCGGLTEPTIVPAAGSPADKAVAILYQLRGFCKINSAFLQINSARCTSEQPNGMEKSTACQGSIPACFRASGFCPSPLTAVVSPVAPWFRVRAMTFFRLPVTCSSLLLAGWVCIPGLRAGCSPFVLLSPAAVLGNLQPTKSSARPVLSR